MQIYEINEGLGPYKYDEIRDKYQWIVVDYTTGCYEGWGTAVALGYNDKLYSWNLGHCSCYGPTDGEPREIALDDITKMRDSVHSEFEEKLIQKVLELTGQS